MEANMASEKRKRKELNPRKIARASRGKNARMDKSYKNPHLPIEQRVKDLLSRMTVAEKVAQLRAHMINWADYSQLTIKERVEFIKQLPVAEMIPKEGLGQICVILRDMPPREAAEKANEIQAFATKHTRLGIPVIIHDEGLHGLLGNGATSFPQAIAMASSWNPELLEKVAAIIGKETRTKGIAQLLSPTINIARDVRCGRTEETYGEDPYLASRLAVAFVRGLQSQRVAATPKHFAANFVGDGGRDSNVVHFSERILREIYFPAFEACIKEANALSIMAAYNSLDGIPCSCNTWLLTTILRKAWNFKGFVVSDYGSVHGIIEKHRVAETPGEVAKKAIEAGLDIELPAAFYYGEPLLKGIKEGKISQRALDAAVSNVLRVKFVLGLFDSPYADPDGAARACNSQEHREIALQMARESIVLLKNENNLLPLGKQANSIAVIGPNADEIRLGGYSWDNYTKDIVVTPLEGVRGKASQDRHVYFAQGCTVKGKSKEGFQEAISIAKKSNAAILFMGNSSETEGEERDRANLDLPGVQEELIEAIAETGVPTIVVLINGSAITMSNWTDRVGAIVEAWYPGEEGGNAIADVLFGDYNPGGKLPITFPLFVGQLPLYYNYKPSGRIYDYVDLSGKPLFPFGHGLSYTTFEYSNLKVTPEKAGPSGTITISVDIRNTGNREGDEVVQLYVHDVVASVARPVKELKGFKRITLKPGARQKVEFVLGAQQLGFYDAAMKFAVASGAFEVMVGSSSEDLRLKGTFEIKEKR
jgi:beta-glucosidase